MEIFIWIGIVFCALKAATFSGLNLAYFSIPYLRLKVLAKKKNPEALKILELRNQPNFLLSTILWGNVSYNVLLTLLTNSVMAGMTSFFFSTIVLTLVGEILPQATFSRKALKFGAFFVPMMKFYEFVLYPISKPTALALDYFLGKESPQYYSERDLISFIEAHLESGSAEDISTREGRGAIHFLELDDKLIKDVGQKIQSEQIVPMNFKKGHLVEPDYIPHPDDHFIKKLMKFSGMEVVLVSEKKEPKLVLALDAFLRALFEKQEKIALQDFCHVPVVVTDPKAIVSDVLSHFETLESDDLERVYIVYWHGRTKKILTSEDLVYLLMKEI